MSIPSQPMEELVEYLTKTGLQYVDTKTLIYELVKRLKTSLQESISMYALMLITIIFFVFWWVFHD